MKYYKTRQEAEKKKTDGSKIYYREEYGYYIVNPKKNKVVFFSKVVAVEYPLMNHHMRVRSKVVNPK